MDSYKFGNYPTMIPKMWLTEEEAAALGYSPEINYDNAISKIEWNQPLIAFSISNVKKDKYDYHNILSIRLDGPLMRIRMIYYNLVLASCSTFPLLTSLVCLFTEIAYLTFVLVTVCKYRYQKNWFVILSRVNVSLAIVVINLLATYIGATQDRTPTGIKEVNSILQLVCVIIVVVCIVLELMLMTFTGLYAMTVFLWYQIRVCRKRIQKRQRLPVLNYVWTVPEQPVLKIPKLPEQRVVKTKSALELFKNRPRRSDPFHMPDSDDEKEN